MQVQNLLINKWLSMEICLSRNPSDIPAFIEACLKKLE